MMCKADRQNLSPHTYFLRKVETPGLPDGVEIRPYVDTARHVGFEMFSPAARETMLAAVKAGGRTVFWWNDIYQPVLVPEVGLMGLLDHITEEGLGQTTIDLFHGSATDDPSLLAGAAETVERTITLFKAYYMDGAKDFIQDAFTEHVKTLRRLRVRLERLHAGKSSLHPVPSAADEPDTIQPPYSEANLFS